MPTRTINSNDVSVTVMEQTLTSSGPSEAVRVRGSVAIQYTGTATSINAVVERSTIDPGTGGSNWARVEDAPVTGNPASGMTVSVYSEPAVAWWRVRLTSITGSNVTVSISGTV